MGIATSNPSGPFHRHFAKVTSVVTQRLHSTAVVAVVIAWAPVAVADAPGVPEAALDKDIWVWKTTKTGRIVCPYSWL